MRGESRNSPVLSMCYPLEILIGAAEKWARNRHSGDRGGGVVSN